MERLQNEAFAHANTLRVSPQKLNLLARFIRRLPVDQALQQLEFSKRRIAIEVRKTLLSAVANAEQNHQLDIDRLYVKQAYVGQGLKMKRFRARGRGRGSRIVKPFARLTICVAEQEAKKMATKPIEKVSGETATGTGQATATSRQTKEK